MDLLFDLADNVEDLNLEDGASTDATDVDKDSKLKGHVDRLASYKMTPEESETYHLPAYQTSAEPLLINNELDPCSCHCRCHCLIHCWFLSFHGIIEFIVDPWSMFFDEIQYIVDSWIACDVISAIPQIPKLATNKELVNVPALAIVKI